MQQKIRKQELVQTCALVYDISSMGDSGLHYPVGTCRAAEWVKDKAQYHNSIKSTSSISSVLGTHVGQLTTTCKSSSRGTDGLLWPLLTLWTLLTHMDMHTHSYTSQKHIYPYSASTRACARTHTHTHSHRKTNIQTHTHTQIYTNTHAHKHKDINIYKHICIHTNTDIQKNTYTYTHKQIHMETHTQTHIPIKIKSLF